MRRAYGTARVAFTKKQREGAGPMKKVRTPRFPRKARRLSALVSVALWAGLPFAARAEAPAVTWQAPLSGAVLRGTIGGSTCAVDATSSVGMQRVIFWINQMQINNAYSAPWNCS